MELARETLQDPQPVQPIHVLKFLRELHIRYWDGTYGDWDARRGCRYDHATPTGSKFALVHCRRA